MYVITIYHRSPEHILYNLLLQHRCIVESDTQKKTTLSNIEKLL